MATAVPAQVTTALLVCACCSLSTGCGDRQPSAAAATRAGQPAAALPEDASAAVDALLQRSHSVLRGADKLANAIVMLGRSADDPSGEQVILSSGDRMHVTRRDGRVDVRLPGGAWRITKGEKPIALDAPAQQRLDRFQTLLRAALLEPLYRAQKLSRQGPTVYQLIMAGGETWRLEVATFQPDQGDAIILPKSLSGPAGELTWLEYRHNGTVTHLPRVMQLGEFGKVWYTLEDSDLAIDEGWYTDPLSPAPTRKRNKRLIQDDSVSSLKVGIPVLGHTRASRSLILSDPGSWPGRYDLAEEQGAILGTQGQEAADLDFVFEAGGKRYFAMPFMMNRETGRPFVALPGQVVERLPDQRVVLVRPPKGSLEACEKAARAALAAFVAEHKLQVTGPLRLRPMVEMGVRPKSMRGLEQLWVHCELPVEDKR
jgi:hypothetical protein